MYTYGRVFEILLEPVRPIASARDNHGNNHSVRATVEVGFNGGLILQPEASKQLYYIFTNATRYRFARYEEVIALGLANAYVHTDVPFEIITVFPPVHMHHNE